MTIGTSFSGDTVIFGGEGSDTISFVAAEDYPVYAAAPVDYSFWTEDGISIDG